MGTEEKHNINLQNWEFIRNMTRKERIELEIGNPNRRGSSGYAWYKCKKCGQLKIINKSNFKTKKTLCDNGCYGANSMKIITGINDIATTNPDLVQYFSNVEDAFKYSAGSGIKTHMHCPNCGYKKDMIISNLTQFGFSCPYCSDGISYPEKFMIGILEQLQLKYDRQITYDNHIHKYDFFVNGIIIETHGEQHYRNTQWATYDKQHEIDMYKYDLAVLNGHEFNKTYIVIDSRHSSVSWMKENVMSSELPNLLNFKEEDIDWIKIGKQIEKSLVKEICEYYKKYGGTPQELAKKFPVCRRTIGRYLKKGHELGWCQYNVKQGQRTDIEREAI